jgi:hypothetical protein
VNLFRPILVAKPNGIIHQHHQPSRSTAPSIFFASSNGLGPALKQASNNGVVHALDPFLSSLTLLVPFFWRLDVAGN